MKGLQYIIFSLLVPLVVFPATSHALFGLFGGRTATVQEENGLIRIPVSEVSDGNAHHFRHAISNQEVRFFILQSSDGVFRAAFDACDVCFREKKGYSQSGEFMICNNCGQRFHSSRINLVKGGCNPAPLMRKRQGDHIIIKRTDLEVGTRYF